MERFIRSKDFLVKLMANVTSAVYILDPSYRIVSVNKPFRALFGLDIKEDFEDYNGNILGCSFAVENDFKCLKAGDCVKCSIHGAFEKALKEKKSTYKNILERTFYIKNQPVRKTLQFTVKPIEYDNAVFVMVIVDDITELVEANSKKDQLLGMIAHDLRNPLSALTGFIDLLFYPSNLESSEKTMNILNLLRNVAVHMNNLIDDILDFNVIESGNLKLNPERGDYKKLITSMVEINRLISSKKNIIIELDYQTDIDEFSFDELKISQVINNLLSNAVKYSPYGRHVRVTVTSDKGFVVTSVRDQGPGIPEKDLENIFIPFFKSSSRPTGGESSTGLGLAIVKTLVEAHSGRIEVSSRSGTGSEFTVYLPV
ncbi:MAG: PAS domain-containing sensor histidine kinase [Oligoflexia bacterium]|nr:PAS domain-containing sensor histidine kinase [Oligoflexia bacterium]